MRGCPHICVQSAPDSPGFSTVLAPTLRFRRMGAALQRESPSLGVGPIARLGHVWCGRLENDVWSCAVFIIVQYCTPWHDCLSYLYHSLSPPWPHFPLPHQPPHLLLPLPLFLPLPLPLPPFLPLVSSPKERLQHAVF